MTANHETHRNHDHAHRSDFIGLFAMAATLIIFTTAISIRRTKVMLTSIH